MILFLLFTMLVHGVGNFIERQENPEAKVIEDEKNKENETKKDEDGSENDEEQQPPSTSPRGVLEVPLLTSFSESDSNSNSSNTSSETERCSSFGSSFSKSFLGDNPIWKNFCDQIKKKSAKKFPAISFLGGRDFSRKNLRRRLGRNHSAEDAIDSGDFVVPKPSWRNFSYEELVEATDDFSADNLVGEGGHAKVYKGQLPDGQIVAVKKITKMEKNDEDRVAEFLSELGIIAHVTHTNAAKLIGFSVDNGLHLVLQYLQNGSLATLLHGSSDAFEWKLRYKVAIGVAEGLQYLHYDCPRRIIHRDITASNILLTKDYEPQISDFGLAKWLPEKWVHHVVHPIEGTFGYMAPEYFMHGIVHEKTDVFAFGVLLLELITGRHAVDSSMQSLAMWAKPLLEENNVSQVVDPRLEGKYNVIEISRAMFTASLCLHHLPNMRPNMKKVVKFLKGENGKVDMKQKSVGGKSLSVDACELEDYTSTTYQNDLNRHMQLVMEV